MYLYLHFHYVLSMGAVFALFSAWYFWIPKMLGLNYSRDLGKVHFWIFFFGVNVTFFPQHFLGLQGMPRRISDYPDAFAGWNFISSIGSLFSVFAIWLFLHKVYLQLTEGKATTRNPLEGAAFSTDIKEASLNRKYNSLEWGLSSPPNPHAFVSLPRQSVLEVFYQHLDVFTTQDLSELNRFLHGVHSNHDWGRDAELAKVIMLNMLNKGNATLAQTLHLEKADALLAIGEANFSAEQSVELAHHQQKVRELTSQITASEGNVSGTLRMMRDDGKLHKASILDMIPRNTFRTGRIFWNEK